MAPATPATEMAAIAASTWLTREAGGTDPASLRRALDARYGKDRTFSVPILTALTIARRLGPDGWRHVAQLPFELAAAPHQAFAWLRLPVVSYALPALIAIGQARHVNRPTRNPITRLARSLVRRATLAKLRRHPAHDRRLPRSDAAHQLRRDEPGRRRPGRARGGAPRPGVPRSVRARRWQLADRHQPGDVGDDAVDRGPRGGRAGGDVARRRRPDAVARVAPRSAISGRTSLHARGARRLGVDGSGRRRAGRRRHRRCAARARALAWTGRGRARRRARPRGRRSRCDVAARPAEPRRRDADLLPRLDRPALRPQRTGADRARGAGVVRLASAAVASGGAARRRRAGRGGPVSVARAARRRRLRAAVVRQRSGAR